MQTIPGRRDAGRLALIFLVTFLVLIGCGGDDPQDPDDGNGNGGQTVLSAESSSGWTCDIFVSSYSGPTCTQNTYHSTAIGDFWISGGFRIFVHSAPGNGCCNAQMRDGSITSAKMDLRGYKTLRLKGHLTLYFERSSAGESSMAVWLLSNVPNTPDLELLSEEIVPYQSGELLLEQELDVSLENAIGYGEATLFIRTHVDGAMGDPSCAGGQPMDVYARISNLRIVGSK